MGFSSFGRPRREGFIPAKGALDRARELQVRIPRDLSIVGIAHPELPPESRLFGGELIVGMTAQLERRGPKVDQAA